MMSLRALAARCCVSSWAHASARRSSTGIMPGNALSASRLSVFAAMFRTMPVARS
jgi:hypothetical protein